MSEYATIEHYANHIMDEITSGDVERVSEKLRALGWEEVVRCRDCRHYDDYLGTCLRPSHNFAAESDGFCKWGVRCMHE